MRRCRLEVGPEHLCIRAQAALGSNQKWYPRNQAQRTPQLRRPHIGPASRLGRHTLGIRHRECCPAPQGVPAAPTRRPGTGEPTNCRVASRVLPHQVVVHFQRARAEPQCATHGTADPPASSLASKPLVWYNLCGELPRYPPGPAAAAVTRVGACQDALAKQLELKAPLD